MTRIYGEIVRSLLASFCYLGHCDVDLGLPTAQLIDCHTLIGASGERWYVGHCDVCLDCEESPTAQLIDCHALVGASGGRWCVGHDYCVDLCVVVAGDVVVAGVVAVVVVVAGDVAGVAGDVGLHLGLVAVR